MGLLQFVDRALNWGSRRMVSVAILACLAGIALVVLAYIFKLSQVTFTGALKGPDLPGVTPKEVGYFAAVNWSLYGAVVLPFVVAFCLKMRADMGETVRNLAARRMVRTEDFSAVAPEEFHARWVVDRRNHSIILLIVVVLGLVAVGYDWWASVGEPLALGLPNPPPPLAAGSLDYDWSLAPLMTAPGSELVTATGADVGTTRVFSILAYLLITALSVAVGLAAMVDALFFVAFACGLTYSAAAGEGPTPLPRTWRLSAMPDREGDRLCGFGVFSTFFSSLFCAAIAILIGLHLMMIQNAYLRDPTASSIGHFLADDAGAAKRVVVGEMGKPDVAGAFDLVLGPGLDFVINFNSVIGVALFLFVTVFCVFACWAVLYKSAEAARDRSAAQAAQLAREIKIPRVKVQERLSAMKFWPLGWLSLTAAILIMIFLGMSVVSYRLMLLPIVATVVILLVRMAALFARQLAKARA